MTITQRRQLQRATAIRALQSAHARNKETSERVEGDWLVLVLVCLAVAAILKVTGIL